VNALATVQLRDGRFVMLPVQRIEATRQSVPGLLRQRALWLVACLHLLADEQRHELGGSAARISQSDLAAFTGLSPKSLTKITRALLLEPALEITRPLGPTGPEPTIYRLLGDPSGPRVLITHRALRALRAHVPAGVLAGTFATYLTIAELANEQRADTVTASRQVIARIVGVSSTRSIDEYVAALQNARLICKHALCTRAGQQPVTWELVEPGDQHTDTHATPAAAMLSNALGALRNLNSDPVQISAGPDAEPHLTPCNLDGDPVQSGSGPSATGDLTRRNLGQSPSAECQDPAVAPAAPIARAGDGRQDKQPQDTLNPNPTMRDAQRGGGGPSREAVEQLCTHFAASLARRATPAILRRPGGWLAAADAWRRAATSILAEIELDRAVRAIDCIEADAYLARHIRDMPTLAERLEEVLLHLSALDARAGTTQSPATSSAPAWAEANQRISAAIRRHGTTRSAAIVELSLEHQAYELFIGLVGWTNLCREDPQRRQWDWQQAWKQACQTATNTEEAA